MKLIDSQFIDYLVICIYEFSGRYGLKAKSSYLFLKKSQGLAFLKEFYDVEHTLSFEEVVDDLTTVCQKNGGTPEPDASEPCMTNQQQAMIEYTTQDVIRYIIEDQGVSLEEAMDQFYLSRTFEKLNDPETGLYLEGSAYVYEILKREQGRSPND